MTGADDYAKFKIEREKTRAAAAASVVRSLRETNPDQKAKATTVAGVLGVPDQIYEVNPSHFDALLEERFNTELLRRSPRLSTALTSDPRLAALAHDDLQNLGFWEGNLNSIYRGGLNIEKAAAINLRNEAMQREADKSLTFGEIYNTERQAEALTPEILRDYLPFDAIAAIGRWKEARLSELMMGDETERALGLNQRAAEVDAAIAELPSTVRATAAKTTFNDTYERLAPEGAGDMEKASAALAAIGETFSSDWVGASEFLINTFLESAPMLAGAATVGVATKNPNAAAAFTYAMSSSLERSDVAIQYLGERGYDLTKPGELERLLKDPAMMRDANARAAISGMIVGGFDALSMQIAGVQLTKGGFREVLAQGGVQMLFGGGGAYFGRTAAGLEADGRDVLLEALLEIPSLPFDAVAVGRNILRDNRAAEAAQNRRDMFAAISDSAQKSKLRGRMPKAYAAFVDQVTKGGPIATLFVPAQKFVEYFQSAGVDPEMVASSLNVTPEALAAAVDAGGDISFATATYAEKVAGSRHDGFFMDNMRVSPEEMTMAEAKAFEAQREALTAEAQTEAEKAQAQAQLEQTAMNSMFARVRAALVSAGRSTAEADTNAAVYPAFFTAMAERAGMTPDQLMDRIGLPRIEGAISPVAEDLATEPDLPAVLSELRAAVAPAPVEGADPAAQIDMAPAAPSDERLAAIKEYLDEIGADLSMSDDEIAALIEGDVSGVESEGRRYAQEALDTALEDGPAELEAGADVPDTVDAAATLDAANALSQGQSWTTGRDLKLALQSRLKAAQEAAGVDVSQPTEGSLRYLTRVGVKDALMALRQNPNAIGWYDEKTRQALAVMSLIHPEIATNENARFAFTWALAVTSNGLKVGKNFELADTVYRRYKAEGRMPSDLTAGQAQIAINESLALFNELSEKWGMDALRQFMQTNFTVGEISSISKELKPSGEFAATEVRGSAILGPKIGNGFFSNLYGNFDALTMDRWLIRTWGRWTGTLIMINEPQVVASRQRLRSAIAGIDAAELASALRAVKKVTVNKKTGTTTSSEIKPKDREGLIAAFEAALAEGATDQQIDELAAAVAKASMEPKLREAMNKVKGGEALRKSGNALAKYNDGQKEAPSGPAERNYIREVFGRMLAELKAMPEYADLTMADLQAVLWYAEKRLYETAKEDAVVAEDDVAGYEDEDAPDYANAAAGVAREAGVPEAKIKAALKRESKDGRAAAARRRNGEAQEGGSQQQAAAGGFARAEKREFVQTRAIHRVRSARRGDAAAWSYGARSAGDGGKARVLKTLGVTYSSEWKAGRSLATAFRANGIATPEFVELAGGDQKNAEAFVAAISAGRETLGDVGKAVYVYPAEEYTGMRLFLTKDGKAGFALKPDGDIVSVFSSAGTGAGRAIMETAIAAGGRKLDAFHTILPSFYAAHGFKGVARLAWADDQAPDGWDKAAMAKFNKGEPDVVFMVYDPDHFGGYDQKATPLKKGDGAYGAALKAQAKAVKSVGAGLTLNQGAVDGQGRSEQTGDGSGRYAAGGLAPLAGAPVVEGASGPDARLVAVAEQYARDNGIPLRRQAEFVEVDPERGARIAAAYEAMPHAPQDPAVKEAYQNLIAQTLAQYRALEAAGYQFYFFDETNDPYDGNPWNAMRDLRANQRMGVFATEAGFGSGATELNVEDNPLLADTGIVWGYGSVDGEPKRVLANDLFRAVHDAFGHGLEGAGFRARGEENAWQAHVRLFTGSAVAAITSETRGQNSWLNFGPYGEKNRTASVEETVFADQKTGLMPSWTWEEGRAGDEGPMDLSERLLFQNMAGTARGSITLPAGGLGKGEAIIRMFATADLSTFMHESGHFFLAALQVLAADPQATPEIRSMYDTVKNWWADNAAAVAADGQKVTGTKVTADDVLAALVNGTTGDRAKDLAIDIGMQEQWARGWELYLFEGKAPSTELRSVFERMAEWLKLIYRSALGLNVKITPELRSVFDRMLATDEQMQAAQEDMSDAPLFESAEQAGMTPEEFKTLLRLHEEARGQMMADLLEQTMEPIRRQRMQSWKEERAKVEGEVRKEVASRPVYVAIAALRFGRGPSGDPIDPPVKLSREAIEQAYPDIAVGQLAGATKGGKGHRYAVFSSDEGGMHPDIVASMYGYQTGRELLLDLATAPDMESVVKAETDAIMAERYPDPLTDGTIADEAIKALHNDKRAAALERELAALTKMAGEGKAMTAKEARAVAQASLKAMPVKAAGKPAAFLAAERRAAREAIRLARLVGKQGVRAADARQAVRSEARAAVRDGEVADPVGMVDTFEASNAALETTTFTTQTKAGEVTATRRGYNDNLAALIAAKRQQLLNHMLYSEARKIEAQVDSVRTKLSKLNKTDAKLSKARDINHVKAARAIAAKFGLARGDSSFDFAMWVEQLAIDDPLTVSAMVAAIDTYGQDAKPYEELTVLQFKAVADAINSVLEVGKALKKAEIDGKAADRDAIIGELTTIAASRQKGRELGETRRLTKGEQRNIRLLSFRASLIRVEAWARDMDDGKLGPFNRYIVKPVQDALGRYRDDRVVRMQQLLDILNPRRKELLGSPISAPELTNAEGEAYTFENKGELLHAILHTGNDSNFQKLLIGRGWSAGFINRKPKMTASGKPSVNRQGVPILDKGVLDTSKWDAFMARMYREGVITKDDIDTVTKIWRLMDETKRPAQTAHKRIYGYYFNEIEPRMVDTPWGPVKGGYVPAIGDRLASPDAGRRQAEAAMEANAGTAMFPTTGSGFTKGRVEQYRTPLELNLMLLPSHLDKVLRFTHLEPIIRQTASIVNDKGFRSAMLKVDPKLIDVMVIPWLQRAASQTVETRAANDGDWQHWRLWRNIRRRAGISTMFANVVNTAQQITGLSTAALLVKPSRLASATVSFLGSPLQTRETVMASSAYMRNRMGSQSQDLSRLIEEAVVKPTTAAEIEAFFIKHGYFMQTAFQNVIDPIVWTASYDQSVAKGMTHEEAVFEADSVVRRTQSDIQPENVSSFEAGTPFARLFTMFYSYFNAQMNLVGGELATAIRTLGWSGAPRYTFIYLFGIAIPAIAAEAIVQASRGELGDEDDDGWEDDLLGLFLGSQLRYLTAFLPFVGNVTNAAVGPFTTAFYDDRISTSPAVSFVERATRAPYSTVQAVQDPDKIGRAVGDTATLLALLLGIPAGQFAKTTGFLFDTSTGRQDPETPLDVTRGLITGRSGT